MAKKKSNKGVNALLKINRRAKQIVAYSGGSYRVAHKKASAEYRADHKPKAHKKSVGKVHRKKTVTRKRVGKAREVGKDKFDNKRVSITVGAVRADTIHQDIARAKNKILDKLMFWEGKKFTAVKVSDRRKIEKRISKLRSDYRKLSHIG